MVESEFHSSSFTLYRHVLCEDSEGLTSLFDGSLNVNSPCRSPFLSKNTKYSQKQSSLSGSGAGNGREKLDDLADCLLQGVAWMRWLANQQKLEKMFPLDFNVSEERG